MHAGGKCWAKNIAKPLWISLWKSNSCQAWVLFTGNWVFCGLATSLSSLRAKSTISAKQHGTLASLETKSAHQPWLCEQVQSKHQDFDPWVMQTKQIEVTLFCSTRLQSINLEHTTIKITSTYLVSLVSQHWRSCAMAASPSTPTRYRPCCSVTLYHLAW